MRIDKLLCEMNIGSRSQVKELLKKGQVLVNGVVIKKPDVQVKGQGDDIICQGKKLTYKPFVYYMMNKPAGVVSATKDTHDRTVLDLFAEQYSLMTDGELTGIPLKDIFPVGRLDKDTVGLLLLTNDGELSHNLLSPKKHVKKKYLVKTDLPLSKRAIEQLQSGVDIGEELLTLPAIVEQTMEQECLIQITEGKFHQVKRMFQSVGLMVLYLKRVSMGSLVLDESLMEGQIRELTKEEVSDLCLKK